MAKEEKDSSAVARFHIHHQWATGQSGPAPHSPTLLDQQETF